MKSARGTCPLGCGGGATFTPWRGRSTTEIAVNEHTQPVRIECEHCTSFYLLAYSLNSLSDNEPCSPSSSDAVRRNVLPHKKRLCALLNERHREGLTPPCLLIAGEDPPSTYWGDPSTASEPFEVIQIDEFLRAWPTTVPDRLDRALISLGRMSTKIGQRVQLSGPNREYRLFATDPDEAHGIMIALKSTGLISTHEWMGWGAEVELTPHGWTRFTELTRTRSAKTNLVFVAMWYGGDPPESRDFMRSLFDDHMKPAIKRAGYKSDRVDLVEHNDFIMDKVLGMIRVAPFVVADFTGNRGGVYYEAAFARGLGIPVIHTCRESHFKDAHFDIKQISTIVWDTAEQLAEKLYHRIMGSSGIGPGPFWKGQVET